MNYIPKEKLMQPSLRMRVQQALDNSKHLRNHKHMAETTIEAAGTYIVEVAKHTGATIPIPFVDGTTKHYQWIQNDTVYVDPLGNIGQADGVFINLEKPSDTLFEWQAAQLVDAHLELLSGDF